MSQFQPPFQQEPQQQPPQYQQLHTGYPQWQQPPQQWYPPPQQFYQQSPPMQPKPPVAKKASLKSVVIIILGVLLVGVLAYLHAQGILGSSGVAHNVGMSEQQYKDSTMSTTVADLDKDGNADSGRDVHFAATILGFVKDSSGNTAGANVTGSGTFTSIIQVEFSSSTDVSQLNVQNQIEVWGTDDGTATGTNAFGATVHEVAISALYITDQTTGYSQ